MTTSFVFAPLSPIWCYAGIFYGFDVLIKSYSFQKLSAMLFTVMNVENFIQKISLSFPSKNVRNPWDVAQPPQHCTQLVNKILFLMSWEGNIYSKPQSYRLNYLVTSKLSCQSQRLPFNFFFVQILFMPETGLWILVNLRLSRVYSVKKISFSDFFLVFLFSAASSFPRLEKRPTKFPFYIRFLRHTLRQEESSDSYLDYFAICLRFRILFRLRGMHSRSQRYLLVSANSPDSRFFLFVQKASFKCCGRFSGKMTCDFCAKKLNERTANLLGNYWSSSHSGQKF